MAKGELDLADNMAKFTVLASDSEDDGGEEGGGESGSGDPCLLPVVFTKKRHVEKIEGSNIITQTWRMKERVGDIR